MYERYLPLDKCASGGPLRMLRLGTDYQFPITDHAVSLTGDILDISSRSEHVGSMRESGTMPAKQIRSVPPPPLYFFSSHFRHQRASFDILMNTFEPCPMSQGELGGRPVPGRCARMTLVHALTRIVDV